MGGFIPESRLDITVDFDELTKAGLTLGPGLLSSMRIPVSLILVEFFLTFLANESVANVLRAVKV